VPARDSTALRCEMDAIEASGFVIANTHPLYRTNASASKRHRS
jgi:hypothetical protein